jgi:hypothetical protein
VVSLERDGHDWLDAPILYIASDQPPRLKDADYAKIKEFIDGGGLVFAHSDRGSIAFSKWVNELAGRVCPAYPLRDLPENHEVYSIVHRLNPRPKLRAATNGSRLLIVHAPDDLAGAWQARAEKTRPESFQLMANLFVYASGKADPRRRLSTPCVREPTAPPTATVKVARLKYNGNWEPEPGAWPRFGRYYQWETGSVPAPVPVAIADLKPGDGPVGHLTGTGAYDFTPAEAAALRAYVEAGGVLLIDACGGSAGFRDTVEQRLFPAAFPGVAFQPLSPDQPPLKKVADGWSDLSKPRFRPMTLERLGRSPTGVRMAQLGKGYVIESPLDLSTGLVGSNSWGVIGYQPDWCDGFVKNVLLWSQDRR